MMGRGPSLCFYLVVVVVVVVVVGQQNTMARKDGDARKLRPKSA